MQFKWSWLQLIINQWGREGIDALTHGVCYLSQAISFLTPLAVIFVVKIIRRTDKTEIKEAFLGNVCHSSRWNSV